MNTSLITWLRVVMSVLSLVFPFTANAYTSSGIDGYFNPVTSMVLDVSQQTFNFTDMFIPSGVTISFSGLTSAQSIEMFAMGNIDIAGTIDLGLNSLWLETPGNISVLGSILSSGGNINIYGDMKVSNNPITINSRGGIILGGGGILKCLDCFTVLTPVPEPKTNAMMLIGLSLVGFMVRSRKSRLV